MTRKQALALLGAAILLVLLCVVVAGGLLLVKAHQEASTAAQPAAPVLASGYLDATASAATYLEVVTHTHGHVSGLWFGTIANSDGSVSVFRGTFSGSISGARLVLTFAGAGAGDTDTGTLTDGGKVLTLEAPSSNGQVVDNIYHAATVSQYNAAVKALPTS